MDQIKKNKEFIMRYANAINGIKKQRHIIEQYVSDVKLTEHILFFDTVFPNYELLIDEITAEGNRVILRGRMKGKHEGEFNGIPPTHREVLVPMVVGYEIENEKIVSHWLSADQMLMMEQLGVIKKESVI